MLFEAMQLISGRRFTCRQAEIMIKRSPLSAIQDLDWKEELIITFHSRVLDPENFGLLLAILNAKEHAVVVHRVGWLNVASSIHVNGFYELAMHRPEERKFAKMLMHLNQKEGTSCWTRQRFAWSRGSVDIPGWELNTGWLMESGVPDKGCLGFVYDSPSERRRCYQTRVAMCANLFVGVSPWVIRKFLGTVPDMAGVCSASRLDELQVDAFVNYAYH